MLLMDLLEDKNRFNEYAAAVGPDGLAGHLSRVYDLRMDPGFGRPGYVSGDGAAMAYGKDLEEAEGFFRSVEPDPIPRQATASYWHRGLCTALALRRWAVHKRVYAPDADFYEDFRKTERVDLDFNLLARTPFPSCYIDLAGLPVMRTNHYRDVAGVLVNVLSKSRIHLVFVDADNPDYNPLRAYMGHGARSPAGKPAEPFPASWSRFYSGPCRFVDVMLDKSTACDRAAKKSMYADLGWSVACGGVVEGCDLMSPVVRDLTAFTVQFLYFLCSEKPDAEPDGLNAGHGRSGGGSSGPVDRWTVGGRYGRTLRTIRRKQTLYGGVTCPDRKRPRPYVRCAHWHRYWCGSGADRRLEVRWVEPAFCNGSMADVIATINAASDADGGSSKGEELVAGYLDRYGVDYEREWGVAIKGHARRFDFLVHRDGGDVLIEFDGEQHFRPVDVFGGEAGFLDRRRADRDKNREAHRRRMPLLRIRFDQADRIPDLIDAFLERPSRARLNPELSNGAYYEVG